MAPGAQKTDLDHWRVPWGLVGVAGESCIRVPFPEIGKTNRKFVRETQKKTQQFGQAVFFCKNCASDVEFSLILVTVALRVLVLSLMLLIFGISLMVLIFVLSLMVLIFVLRPQFLMLSSVPYWCHLH